MAIALSLRFCSWVVQEDLDGEDVESGSDGEGRGAGGSSGTRSMGRCNSNGIIRNLMT